MQTCNSDLAITAGPAANSGRIFAAATASRCSRQKEIARAAIAPALATAPTRAIAQRPRGRAQQIRRRTVPALPIVALLNGKRAQRRDHPRAQMLRGVMWPAVISSMEGEHTSRQRGERALLARVLLAGTAVEDGDLTLRSSTTSCFSGIWTTVLDFTDLVTKEATAPMLA
jgi:hypothetical protein